MRVLLKKACLGKRMIGLLDIKGPQYVHMYIWLVNGVFHLQICIKHVEALSVHHDNVTVAQIIRLQHSHWDHRILLTTIFWAYRWCSFFFIFSLLQLSTVAVRVTLFNWKRSTTMLLLGLVFATFPGLCYCQGCIPSEQVINRMYRQY